MEIIYDESIFIDGSIYIPYKIIAVSNRADKYLVERLGKSSTTACDSNASISINPKINCKGINVHTINILSNKKIINYHYFHKLYVITVSDLKPINFEEPIINTVYDVNNTITPYETAIMLKYYAYKNSVNISTNLYYYVKDEFKDLRDWFVFN